MINTRLLFLMITLACALGCGSLFSAVDRIDEKIDKASYQLRMSLSDLSSKILKRPEFYMSDHRAIKRTCFKKDVYDHDDRLGDDFLRRTAHTPALCDKLEEYTTPVIDAEYLLALLMAYFNRLASSDITRSEHWFEGDSSQQRAYHQYVAPPSTICLPFWRTRPQLPAITTYTDEFKRLPEKRINRFLIPDERVHAYGVANLSETKSVKYLKQIFFKKEDRVIVMGDIHGSVHSLLRSLWHLVETKDLTDDFKLRQGVQLVFLGDVSDYGSAAIPAITLLLSLKLNNWEAVHIGRGNHEDPDFFVRANNRVVSAMNDINVGGLATEIGQQYIKTTSPKDQESANLLYNTIIKYFGSLPYAIVGTLKAGDPDRDWHILMCHGALDPMLSIREFVESDKLYAPIDHLALSLMARARRSIPSYVAGDGFFWSDCTGLESSKHLGNWEIGHRGAGFVIGIKDLEALLAENKLRFLFRGHQDYLFSCKVIKPRILEPVSIRTIKQFQADIASGEIYTKGFKIREFPDDFAKCITHTTAAEGRGNFDEGYLVFEPAEDFESSTIRVYSNLLQPGEAFKQGFDISGKYEYSRLEEATAQHRQARYVRIKGRDGNYEDSYAAAIHELTDDYDPSLAVDEGLKRKAFTNKDLIDPREEKADVIEAAPVSAAGIALER